MSDRGIVRGYSRLNAKMNDIQKEIRQLLQAVTTPVKLTQNERLILMKLPSHLSKTYFTLENIGKATAIQISHKTGKARAVESSYLNQLAIMGFVFKRRSSRQAVFSCNSKE